MINSILENMATWPVASIMLFTVLLMATACVIGGVLAAMVYRRFRIRQREKLTVWKGVRGR